MADCESFTGERLVHVGVGYYDKPYSGEPYEAFAGKGRAEGKHAAPSADLEKHHWDLRERTKKLHCLFHATETIFTEKGSLHTMLEHLVRIIPGSFQFPDITCAKVILDGRIFETPGCGTHKWVLEYPIYMKGKEVGELVACYTREPPTGPEDPFLEEEWALLLTIARNLSLIVEVQNLQKTLQDTRKALTTVMNTINEEKYIAAQHISRNVQMVLLPLIQDLHRIIPTGYLKYVALLQSGLLDVTSPFVDSLSERFNRLTHSEIQICSLIRSGLQSKEIARIKGICPSTVYRHRENIRRKLGITNRNVNLANFLRADT